MNIEQWDAEIRYNWWLMDNHPEALNEKWRKEDELEEVLSELERQYKKPRFDQFEIFKPTKGFLKEKIRELKQQSYAKTQVIIRAQQEEQKVSPKFQREYESILSRIKQYEYFLSGGEKSGSINEADIRAAKEVPINLLFNSTTKRSGRTLTGRCSLHAEKSGSFTIYIDNNTWFCFGACGVGGDAIDYIQKRDGLNFIEAVKFLINR